MNTKLVRIIIYLSVIIFSNGCANNSKIENTIDCEQPITIVIDSPEDVVSEDGFTIYYDGKSTSTLERLMKVAFKIQNSFGCNNSLDKLLKNKT